MADLRMMEYPEKLFDGYYRVMESTDEHAEELGAFRLLANAKRMCDLFPGSHIIMDRGTKIYPVDDIEDDVAEPEQQPNEGGGEEVIIPPDDTGNSEDTVTPVEPDEGSGEEVITPSEPDNGNGEDNTVPDDEVQEPDKPAEAPAETPAVAYAKLKTVMHIREEPDESGQAVTIYNTGTIVKVLAICENGWLKIACKESEDGVAYVCNDYGKYANVGSSYYVVTIEKDRLEAIAERLLGKESRYMEIRSLNMLTSNQTYVGMELIIP